MARSQDQRGGRRWGTRWWSRVVVIGVVGGLVTSSSADVPAVDGESPSKAGALPVEVWVPPVGSARGESGHNAGASPSGEVESGSAAVRDVDDRGSDRAIAAERVVPTLSAHARPLGPARGRIGSGESASAGGKDVEGAAGGGVGVRGEIPRTVMALGGVLTLILVFAAAVKKFGRGVGGRGWSIAAMLGPAGRAPSGVMRVLARYPAARGQTLVLLQVDRRVLLLSHTHPSLRLRGGHGGFSTLAEFTEPEEVASLVLKSGAAGESASDGRFVNAMLTHDAGYAAIERVDPAETAGGAPPEAEPNRLVRRNVDGDRAELWDDRAVLRPSRDGREWVSSDAMGAAGASVRADAGETAGPAVSVDAMDSIRHRLAGLRGRGVLG
ncbi:MAG: FliO/MopB family protein [Phycisphaeraceae bacterium]|nr:FliO/MopB family protein [Phycisphaeraceae bacterium]